MKELSRLSKRAVFAVTTLALACIAAATPRLQETQAQTQAAEAHTVPVVDGGAGSCSADFTITDNAGSPIYAAKVHVHVEYGFLGTHRLDLEAGTNVDGKARFTGLPQRTRHGLFYSASEGGRDGSAFQDPASNCKAQFTIALQKKNP